MPNEDKDEKAVISSPGAEEEEAKHGEDEELTFVVPLKDNTGEAQSLEQEPELNPNTMPTFSGQDSGLGGTDVSSRDEELGAGREARYTSSYENNDEDDEDEDDDDEEEEEDDDEADVPLFANRENRQLRKEIVRREKKIEDLQDKVDEDEERQRAMLEHIKSVEQELKHAEQLLEAKSKELRTEDHMRQLAEREAGRIRAEINKLDGKKEDVLSQLSLVQNEIFKTNDVMEKHKVNMNYNQEALEQWTLAMNQNQDDQDAFERYMKTDSAKVKELNFTVEKLTLELQEKRKALDEEVTETQAKQIELDKTAEEFRARHKERQDIIKQWQDAIAQVKARDEEIQRAGEQYAASKEESRVAQKELLAERARVERLKQDCADMESKSKTVDNMLQKRRSEEVSAKERLETFRAEVDLLKIEVAKASNEVQQERQKLASNHEMVEVYRGKLELARERFQHAKEELAKAKGDNNAAEISASAAEDLLKAREGDVKAIETKLANLKEAMFRESESLFQFRQREANLLAEISGAQATGKNLSHEIQRLDDESLRQKELVYTAEFQIQQLERKVARANGVRSDEEKKVLNKKIAACQKELEAAQSQHTMLLSQVKNLEEELRKTKRTAKETTERRKELSSRLNELKLENSSAESMLQGIMKQKEELMVNNDLMKLQVKGLRDQLTDKADKVFGLENRKFQLEMSMQERKKEIQVHSDMQKARAKIAEEERHKLAVEAKECKLKVSRLEKKFATICTNSKVGGDGEERSQAYFVIAAAQKREELQREGDELDAKIRKATREIRALEETLNNINALNSQFRNASHRADSKSKEAQELKRTIREARSAQDAAFKAKKELQRLINDLQEDERRVQQLNEQTQVAKESHAHLSDTQQHIDGELAEQQFALERMQTKIREHAKHHRDALGIAGDKQSVHEVMFKIDMNNQMRDCVLFTLGQLSKEFPEMEEHVQNSLTRFGFSIPTAPPQTPQFSTSTIE